MNYYSIIVSKFKGKVNESTSKVPTNIVIESEKVLNVLDIFSEAASFLKKNYGVTLLEATVNPDVQKATKRMAKKMGEWIEMTDGGEFEYIFMNEDDGTFNIEKITEIAQYFIKKYNKKGLANVKKAASLCRKYLTETGTMDLFTSKDKRCLKLLLDKTIELSQSAS